MPTNKKIVYGTYMLPDDEFDPRNIKERITMFVDQDILDHFRKRAKKNGGKYQTMINQALREAMSKPSLEERIEALEKKAGKRRA